MPEIPIPEPHPDRLDEWPSFKLFSDAIDSRIPVCRVDSWQAYLDVINKEKDDPTGREKVYRGHRRYDWALESTLTREVGGGSISRDLSESLLFRFRLAMRGRGADLAEWDANEVWAFGQHFGLATPLLDWTESPFVSLFFAFSEEDRSTEIENKTRAVFCLNRQAIEAAMDEELFFEPKFGDNGRLVNQAGMFTVTPTGEDNLESSIINTLSESGAVDVDDPNDLAKYICKIHIANNDRVACLASLRKMNIHHANLFPDAAGASQFCNDWLSRYIIETTEKEEFKKPKSSETEKTKIEVKDFIESSGDDEENVALLLANRLPSGVAWTQERINEISGRLNGIFNANASLDWDVHESGVARVKVSFKRLLGVVDYPDETREALIEELLEYFSGKHGSSKLKRADA